MKKRLYSTPVLTLSTTGLIGAQIEFQPRQELDLSDVFMGSFCLYYHDRDGNQVEYLRIDSDEYFQKVFLPNFARFAKNRYVFYTSFPEDERNYDFQDTEVERELLKLDRKYVEETVIMLQEAMEYELIPIDDEILSIDTSGDFSI